MMRMDHLQSLGLSKAIAAYFESIALLCVLFSAPLRLCGENEF
jgi:hypothetical protein